MKYGLIIIATFLLTPVFAQLPKKVEVLTLGTFHFNFPNLDLIKTDAADKIDVLDPEYQKEIEEIVARIARFKPTIIAIEREPDSQAEYDSLYNQYLRGQYHLRRGEEEQIGFRIAKLMGLKKLYCVDAWGRNYDSINTVLKDSLEKKKLLDYFNSYADTLKQYIPQPVFKTKGIRAELVQQNDGDKIRSDLGTYLIGIFTYETGNDEFFGPDYVTGWWFNRNLRIFRNIQRINAGPNDRILVIFGAGHMNLLNLLFTSSPQYKLLKANDYLK